MFLVTFTASDVFKQLESTSLNHFQHWDVHHVSVYFRIGDMRCVRNVQYLSKAPSLEGIELHFQIRDKSPGLSSLQDGQYTCLNRRSFVHSRIFGVLYSLLTAHAIPSNGSASPNFGSIATTSLDT